MHLPVVRLRHKKKKNRVITVNAATYALDLGKDKYRAYELISEATRVAAPPNEVKEAEAAVQQEEIANQARIKREEKKKVAPPIIVEATEGEKETPEDLVKKPSEALKETSSKLLDELGLGDSE